MQSALITLMLFVWTVGVPSALCQPPVSVYSTNVTPAPAVAEPASVAQCSFPDFMTARKVWETRISLGRGVVGALWNFDDSSAMMTNVTTSSVMTFSCIDSTSMDATGNTVLVRVAPFDSSSYNGLSSDLSASTGKASGYQCLRFVKRSQYVVQMWTSPVSSTVNPAIRLCQQLVLDQFPLVYSTLDSEDSNLPASQLVPTDGNNIGGTGCAIVGGYSFTLQPADANSTDTGSRLCADIPVQPVMESDCGCTEGQPSLSIDFRQWFCAGNLGLPLTGKLSCLGSWADPASNYVFSVVADAAKSRSKLWLFRWPYQVPGRQAFVGHVTTELSTGVDAKLTPSSSADVSYAVYMQPTTYSEGLCNDEAPTLCDSFVCSSSMAARYTEPGLSLTETNCQQTCGTCGKDSGNFSNCQLTGSSMGLVGSWMEASSNSKRQRTIAVGLQSMTFASNGAADNMVASCVSFSSGSQSTNIGVRFPVATVFPTTGCRARYACIELIQRSRLVMTYRVGRAVPWPYVPTLSFPTQLGANMLCSDSMFQTSSTDSSPVRKSSLPDATYLDMTHDVRAVVKVTSAGSSQMWSVNCGLPVLAWLLLEGQMANGDSVSATIDQCSAISRSDLFQYSSSSGVVETHQCLASYSDSDTDDQYIITMKQSNDGAEGGGYFCWLFQRRALFGIPNQLFLTNASDCNANTGLRVRSSSFAGYIASFQIVLPPSTDTSTTLFGSALSVARSCVSFTPPTVVSTSTSSSTSIQPTTPPGLAIQSTPGDSSSSSSSSNNNNASQQPADVVGPSTTSPSGDYSRSTMDDGDNNNTVLSTAVAGGFDFPFGGQSSVYNAPRTVLMLVLVAISLTVSLTIDSRLYF